MVLLAFTLEGAQLFIPGRDGRFADACVKATGGILGALAGLLSYAFRRFVARSLSTTKSAAASPT
jgi:VanZ family protein